MTDDPGASVRMLSVDERERRLADGADRLARGQRSILGHPRFLLTVAASLMTFGVCAIVLGWVGASHSTFVEEQVPYLISGGLLGLALAVIGALTLFTHWLTVLVRESRERDARRRQDHIEMMEALAQLSAALERREEADGRAAGERAERPVRRAPRRS